jgi:nicotinamidase-related amidase
MRILQNETASVIVDMQEKLLPHMYDGEKILQNCLTLIDGLQILSIPVMVTQQYTKGLGATDPSITLKFKEFTYFEKNAFSCCDEPEFEKIISRMEKRNIILCGIESHVCVLQTCIDLCHDGFRPVVVEDCVSSRRTEDKFVAIARMRQEGATITTVESLLFELTRYAGSEIFRSISRLVK